MTLRAEGAATVGEMELELDLDVGPGEIVGLVGPNGAGKSGTLAVLVGVLPLRRGRIEHRGVTLDDGTDRLPPHRRGLGWAPQTAALLPRRTPREQVRAFADPGAPLLGAGTVDDLMTQLLLDPEDRRPPARLSGGQAQRVAIARALAASPTVLLDEPTSAQDADGAAAVRRAARRHADAGGGVVVVSHRPEDAYAIADRLVVLDRGRIAQTGTPADLATRPATPYVGQVVGATVLHGDVADGILRGPWGELVVADDVPDGPATAVVRPTAVTLHRDHPSGSARNVLEGTVGEVVQDENGVRVRTATSPPLIAALTADAAHDLDIEVGGRIWASLKATEVRISPR
ncbi:MAG: ABC transporter ATP-binding protein [Actinobacteria bacterium]|nr:ABC transporter ATP-binding protein [Actinomycetota bacterium]